MTRKDYVALAKLIASYRDDLMFDSALDTRFMRDFVTPLAYLLKQDNQTFDCARFLAACDVRAEAPK